MHVYYKKNRPWGNMKQRKLADEMIILVGWIGQTFRGQSRKRAE